MNKSLYLRFYTEWDTGDVGGLVQAFSQYTWYQKMGGYLPIKTFSNHLSTLSAEIINLKFIWSQLRVSFQEKIAQMKRNLLLWRPKIVCESKWPHIFLYQQIQEVSVLPWSSVHQWIWCDPLCYMCLVTLSPSLLLKLKPFCSGLKTRWSKLLGKAVAVIWLKQYMTQTTSHS